MSRFARKARRARLRSQGSKLRGVAFVDRQETHRRIGACGCLKVLSTGGGVLAVEAFHRPGCGALVDQTDERKEANYDD